MYLVGIPHAKLLTKFEVCSPNNFQDIWDRLPQFLGVTYKTRNLGHVPFGENYWRAQTAFPRGSWILNLKSLA